MKNKLLSIYITDKNLSTGIVTNSINVSKIKEKYSLFFIISLVAKLDDEFSLEVSVHKNGVEITDQFTGSISLLSIKKLSNGYDFLDVGTETPTVILINDVGIYETRCKLITKKNKNIEVLDQISSFFIVTNDDRMEE